MAEENFLELLEGYLDEEEMELKKQEDDSFEEKKKISTESPFNIEDTISIGRFVNDYLSIPGDCKDLYHSGLKELESNYVMGVDNNFANKNPELVYQGYLLIVIDAKHHRGTYVNPMYLKKLLDQKDLKKEFKLFNRKRVSDLRKLEDYLRKYEELNQQIQTNEKFYKMIEETKKIGKYKRLLREERKQNDKH